MRKNAVFFYLALLIYLVSFEMLGRMVKAAPLVPSELGKYFLMAFSILGIFLTGIRNNSALIIGILLLPSILFDLSGQVTFLDIVYNLFGPLGLALSVTLFHGRKLTWFEFDSLLRLLWLTSFTALIFTFIKTPDLESIDFNLKAEFATTADTSSNQVATVLGLGMFLSFYSIMMRKKFSGSIYSDIGAMLLFAFQGLLSFSRGGMMVGALGIITLLIHANNSGFQQPRRRMTMVGFAALLSIYAIFNLANRITDGNLSLRYSGETQGTLLGSKEKSADVLVSGRLSIMKDDLDLWFDNPLLGVGAGASRYLRQKTYLVAPHIEFSRLLAEHGLLGLIYFIGLIVIFFRFFRKLPVHANKGLHLALFLIAILTTFHAALRTYVTPVLFMLSLISIQDANPKVLPR